MNSNTSYTLFVALIVSLGGFLFGFDAAIISGAKGAIDAMFPMSPIQEGWLVSSPSFSAAFTMLVIGPISDYFGRKKVLISVAFLYALSAILSAVAPSIAILIFGRMVGGIAFGAALILAPMYISEISPADRRGQMVSVNQLNIVLGFSAAYFCGYFFNQWMGTNPDVWRWMLGIEAIPAIVYFLLLFTTPESPRWLASVNREEEAEAILRKVNNNQPVDEEMAAIRNSIADAKAQSKVRVAELFKPAMRMVLTIGIIIGILQQITGINSIFFYANTIFEQSGIGTDASFTQAIWVGLINIVFTLIAMATIDRFGRKPLLLIGVTGIAISMFIVAYGFHQATYSLSSNSINNLEMPVEIKTKLTPLANQNFDNDVSFKNALISSLGEEVSKYEAGILASSANMNPLLILIGILGFVASFAISLGPVMWVLFSELFPNWLRGVAISFVGFLNSMTSWGVQFIFPWELANFGNALTFLIYGLFAVIGLILVAWLLPETKGKTLEQIEKEFVG